MFINVRNYFFEKLIWNEKTKIRNRKNPKGARHTLDIMDTNLLLRIICLITTWYSATMKSKEPGHVCEETEKIVSSCFGVSEFSRKCSEIIVLSMSEKESESKLTYLPNAQRMSQRDITTLLISHSVILTDATN